MKSYVVLIAAAVCVSVSGTHVEAQAGRSECQAWNAKVDPNVEGKTAIDVSKLSDEDVLARNRLPAEKPREPGKRADQRCNQTECLSDAARCDY